MKDFIDIIKKQKAEIQRQIVELNKQHDIYEERFSGVTYVIHSFEYLLKLSIYEKQDLMLDQLLAEYYAYDDKTEYLHGASPGKEV